MRSRTASRRSVATLARPPGSEASSGEASGGVARTGLERPGYPSRGPEAAFLLEGREQIARPHRLERGRHVLDAGADRRALLEEIVRSFRARIERRAGHGEHLPVLLEREPRGDERPRSARRLDHDRGERQAGDDAIATREVAPARLLSDRHFRYDGAELDDALDQRDGLARVRFCVSSRQNPDGSGFEACGVRALVDAARQPRHHDIARPAEAAREPVGECEAGGGGVARSDDRRRRLLQGLDSAAAGDERRGGVDFAEKRRIVGLADCEEPYAEPARDRELALDLLARRQRDRAARAAAPGKLGQRLERGPRAAVPVEERPEGAGADVLRSDEAQPVEQFCVGKTRRRGLGHLVFRFDQKRRLVRHQ